MCVLSQSLCIHDNMQEVLVVNEQPMFGDETLRLAGRECPSLRSALLHHCPYSLSGVLH